MKELKKKLFFPFKQGFKPNRRKMVFGLFNAIVLIELIMHDKVIRSIDQLKEKQYPCLRNERFHLRQTNKN